MSQVSTFAILATLVLAAAVTAAPFDDVVAPQPRAVEDYRLPKDISPTTYSISLRPYLMDTDGARRFTFDGEATITIVPKVNTKKLVLHSRNLNYTKAEYWSTELNINPTNLPTPTINNVTDKYEYTFTTDLLTNKTYSLHFVYTGSMDDDMHGFYRSSYTDSTGKEKWIGSTQLQRNHARRVFPSFDETRYKATFAVNMTRHNSMKSWGNTRQINNIVNGDLVTDVYATTPNMSTYILAFIVAEFTERNNTQFGVIARPEYYNQTKYSFDVGQTILKHLDSVFGIPYYSMGVDKMHLAAIPDFSAGAMENWGLLTYRERALLYDDESTSLSGKQYIAAVVAHEEAHMWFGDLVTCEWWSYTWLNEGFARYYQYFGTAPVEKDFQIDEQFVVDQVQSVMGMDSTNNTNPLSDENTNTEEELARMFNSISYNKGATFIRMVEHAMGSAKFQASIKDYLKTYQYQNTIPQNLFDIWLKHWGTDGKEHAEAMFKSFTEQVGYPVIYVDVADNGQSFSVSQKRFLLNPNDNDSNKALLYTVPFTYTTDNKTDFTNTAPKFYIPANTNKINTTLDHTANWVIANIQEAGYYRVNYNEKYWHRLHTALFKENYSGIHESNRAQLVDDLLNLARSSEIEYELALDILEYLAKETHYLPWTAAFNGFSYLAIRLGTETSDFASYILSLTELAYKNLGFVENSNDKTLEIYNRAKILAWSCKYGNSDCIEKSKDLFKNLETKPVPVNIRSVVYCVAMREGNDADFEKLFKKYKTETVPTEETLTLNSLGCVKDKALVEKFYKIIVSDDVRRQDKSTALSYLYSENNENVTPMFELVTNDVDKLAEALGGYSSVASVISNIASRFTEQSQLDSLKKFNSDTKNEEKFGSSLSTLKKAENTVTANLEWSKTKLGVFKDYLAKRNGGVSMTSAFTFITITLFATFAMYLH